MASIEVYEGDISVRRVGSNYSHFNVFKALPAGIAVDGGDTSSVHRQAPSFLPA